MSNINITGKVIDQARAPVPGAKVSLFDGATEVASASSSETGYFNLSFRSENETAAWRLAAARPGFQSVEQEVSPDRTSDLSLVLQRSTARVANSESRISLRGHVITGNGQPVPYAKVQVFDGDTEVVTLPLDAEGAFEFSTSTDTEPHQWRILASADGYKSLTYHLTSNEELGLRLVLPSKAPDIKPWLMAAGALLVIGIIVLILRNGGSQPIVGPGTNTNESALNVPVRNTNTDGRPLPKVKVPPLSDLRPTEIPEKFPTNTLAFREGPPERTGQHPAGTIVRTDPTSGTEVAVNSSVVYFVEGSFDGSWGNKQAISQGITSFKIDKDASSIVLRYQISEKKTEEFKSHKMLLTQEKLLVEWQDPQKAEHSSTLTLRPEQQIAWQDQWKEGARVRLENYTFTNTVKLRFIPRVRKFLHL